MARTIMEIALAVMDTEILLLPLSHKGRGEESSIHSTL
jgi:hypothetical protein